MPSPVGAVLAGGRECIDESVGLIGNSCCRLIIHPNLDLMRPGTFVT